MRPTQAKLIAFDEARDQLLVQRELEKALRRSYEDVIYEPLSEAIALLLMRVAFAEMLRSARQGGDESNEAAAVRADELRGDAKRSPRSGG